MQLSERDKENMRTGAEIQRAARDLPDGYEIRITIEKDSGSVDLLHPDGNITGCDNADGMSVAIAQAIEVAVEEFNQ